MILMRYISTLCAVMVFFLAGCTGSDDDSSPPSSQPKALTITKGEFLDSAVEGLGYEHSNGNSGLTNADGVFSYGSGTIEFFIGDISLGSASAEFLMSPVTLAGANDQTAINMARFLQVLDEDSVPSNGIRITQAVRELAVGQSVNFADANFETNVQTVVSAITDGSRNITDISAQEAQDHLNATLLSVRTGLVGEYNGTASSSFSNCPSSAVNTVSRGNIEVISASSSSFDAVGSFSGSARGISIREELTLYATVSVDGTISGTMYSDAYQNGSLVGSANASFVGKYNSQAIQLKTPPQSLDYLQQGCMHNGTLIVVAR